ncbi:hypothetical protein C8R41DRAFT_984447 [Lentinula lateritia]|uniref:General substrate transporter n=1 Tax=Lentinula lateritia TaxID=40482 RepID=A0ABQ8V1R9_9AGAR|nr:hypothetical protein C8R41DRAFT_984447 [Lentinula lateritia]
MKKLSPNAYLRRKPTDDIELLHELAEIETAIEEECEARKGLGWKEAFFQWCGAVKILPGILHTLWGGPLLIDAGNFRYYAPQIFTSIGYTGNKNSLLASGVYGVVKTLAIHHLTLLSIVGRNVNLHLHLLELRLLAGNCQSLYPQWEWATCFSIVGAIIKTHPPPAASQGMAVMLYIYVCFYSMGWDGVLSHGSMFRISSLPDNALSFGCCQCFAVVMGTSSSLIRRFQSNSILDSKFYKMFATVNIGAIGTFSLIIPDTKGRSLEEMDIIFGSVSAKKRSADVAKFEHALDNGPEIGSTRSNDYYIRNVTILMSLFLCTLS